MPRQSRQKPSSSPLEPSTLDRDAVGFILFFMKTNKVGAAVGWVAVSAASVVTASSVAWFVMAFAAGVSAAPARSSAQTAAAAQMAAADRQECARMTAGVQVVLDEQTKERTYAKEHPEEPHVEAPAKMSDVNIAFDHLLNSPACARDRGRTAARQVGP